MATISTTLDLNADGMLETIREVTEELNKANEAAKELEQRLERIARPSKAADRDLDGVVKYLKEKLYDTARKGVE